MPSYCKGGYRTIKPGVYFNEETNALPAQGQILDAFGHG